MRVLVTGGAGFIGSNFLRYMLNKHKDYEFICLDNLSYSGNKDNLNDLLNNSRFEFIKADICDTDVLFNIKADMAVNFAAHTHVDRSIQPGAWDFVDSNVKGALSIAEYVLKRKLKKFVHISTDEVYGSIQKDYATEKSHLHPSNLYSATKAGADHIVMAFYKTFGLPVCITRTTNNFGPYQYPEKVIPLFITNLLQDKPVPLYGDGSNIRHWIYVIDNCEAIDLILHKGEAGEIYNISTDSEISNLELAKTILSILNKSESLITFVKDRPGHDWRYAIDSSKIQKLGWSPSYLFKDALEETIDWYKENLTWWQKIKNEQKEYKDFYQVQYQEA